MPYQKKPETEPECWTCWTHRTEQNRHRLGHTGCGPICRAARGRSQLNRLSLGGNRMNVVQSCSYLLAQRPLAAILRDICLSRRSRAVDSTHGRPKDVRISRGSRKIQSITHKGKSFPVCFTFERHGVLSVLPKRCHFPPDEVKVGYDSWPGKLGWQHREAIVTAFDRWRKLGPAEDGRNV